MLGGASMIQDIEKILITEEQLQQRIAEIGAQLTEEYRIHSR